MKKLFSSMLVASSLFLCGCFEPAKHDACLGCVGCPCECGCYETGTCNCGDSCVCDRCDCGTTGTCDCK